MNKIVLFLLTLLLAFGTVVAAYSVVIYPLEGFDENTYHYWTSHNEGILPAAITGGVTGTHGYWSKSANWSMGDFVPDPSVGLWYNIRGDATGDQGATTPFTLTTMPIHSILMPPTYTTTYTYPYALTNPANPYSYYKLLQVAYSQGYWGDFWYSGHTSWYCGDVNGGYLITNNPVDMTYPAHLSIAVLKLPAGGGSGYLYVDYSANGNPAGPWTNLIDGHQIQHSSGTWVTYIEDLPAVTLPDNTHSVYLQVRFRGNTTGNNPPFNTQPNYWMDDFLIYNDEEPLPVELSSFTAATSVDNYVNLMWVSQSETGLVGYYIYRNTTDEFATAELISPLIPGTNTSQQQSYIYTDNEIDQDGTYYYWLQSADLDGGNETFGSINIQVQQTGTGNGIIPGPQLRTGVNSVFPNPFTSSTTIHYGVAKNGSDVQIGVYNVKGELVRELVNRIHDSNTNYSVGWNGKDYAGNGCSNGLYFIVLKSGGETSVRKAILVK